MEGMYYRNKKEEIIKSPTKGSILEIEDIRDQVFLEVFRNESLAIEMDSTRVVAPVNGIIEFLFPEEQLIGITSEFGRELIVHLEKNRFTNEGIGILYSIELGQKVKNGELLFEIEGESTVINNKNTLYIFFSEPAENKIRRNKGHVSHNEDILIFKK